GQDHREDDRDAAHGGRAALGRVGGGAVVADELSVAAALEHLDEQRRPEDGHGQGERPRDDDRDHASSPVWSVPACRSSASTSGWASQRRPASREDFSSTASPGRTVRSSTASASSTVSTYSDSPPKLPSRLAP